MATTYTYFQQDNAVDSWIVEEFDDNNQPVSTYVIFDNPNVKPSIQNIKKISAESADFSGSLLITGSVIATAGFTGSLQGTASLATNADAIKTVGAGSGTWYPLMQAGASSGYLTPAFSTLFSFNGGTGVLNVTSSRAVSSSFASTASYVVTAQTASYVQNAISSSFATTASRAVSSSFATTASYATVAQNVLNESSFALLGSPNIFTSNQTITAKLSQGNSTTVGTTKAYSCGISSGVVTLSAVLYGDVTADFNVNDQLLIYDAPFDGNYGIITSKIASVTYDSFVTLSTIITLYDTSIGTTTAYVGDLSVGVANWNGDQTIPANYSHAEGIGTTTLGDYSHAEGASTNALGDYSHAEGGATTANGQFSHAEGNNTIAQGDYQHVQGAYNIASSAQSAFIVGNGTSDDSRSNLIFASGSTLQITGSLIVSGSGTFTNIGPAVFSGSVVSTAGFTGSLQGTATTASFVQNAISSSFASTASFVQNAISSSFASTASFVSGAVGGSGTVGAIAKFSGTATIANATVDVDYLQQDMQVVAAQGMGSSLKGYTISTPIIGSYTQALTFNTVGALSGEVRWIAVWIPKTTTITGVKWYQATTGNYTANNYNGVGLYSHSGGTLTRVASSTDDGNIWKATTNTLANKAFTSTYSAAPGLYYIAAIYCYSAQVTAPSMAGTGTLGAGAAFNNYDFTNSNKLVGYTLSATALPATQALSGVTQSVSRFNFYLY